jgi:hypothetical protein
MDFSEHLIISGAGSAAILAGGGGWPAALAFSATGVFIDLDHFADYWRETGFNLDLGRFMPYFGKREPEKLILFMHGWEPPLILALAWALFGWPAWAAWALAGWLLHLLLDHRFNRLSRFAYFFSYRLKHGFQAEKLYRD